MRAWRGLNTEATRLRSCGIMETSVKHQNCKIKWVNADELLEGQSPTNDVIASLLPYGPE